MDESPGQIEDHIRTTRGALEGNLQELEHRVKDATNWRVQFERHPSVFLGAAFAGGMLLAAVFGPRRPMHPDRNFQDQRSARPQGSGSAAHTIWDKVKGELLAVAETQIGTLVRDMIPARHAPPPRAASSSRQASTSTEQEAPTTLDRSTH